MCKGYGRYLNGIMRLGVIIALLTGVWMPASGKWQQLVDQRALASPSDAWWDAGWPYRLPVTASGSGIVGASVNFSTILDNSGLNHALLDIRSMRVVPYQGGLPGEPIPYAETYSVMLEDAEAPQIGWSDSGVYWTVNDGSAQADTTRHSQGSHSLKAVVENLPGGYGYPGVELHIADGDPLTNWGAYDVFVYDVWPEVNASALDQAPDLYWFKLYEACQGSSVTLGGPPLVLGRWNAASVSLNPLDSCWTPDLTLGNIQRMEFHTRDNDTVNGNSGLWDDGDILTMWFDNLRLVDQDEGQVRWQSAAGVTQYYLYFDILTHEGHDLPETNPGLGQATLIGTVGNAEAGGYYHQVSGASGMGSLQAWTAPTVEKVLQTMVVPVTTAPLRISAAKGEFEPFQVVIRSPTTQDLAISVSSFAKGGEVIPAPTIHRVDYVEITTAGDHFDRFGAWPDPLWPLDQGQQVTFAAGQNQPLWFTVQVPWDAEAGIYQASVQVGAASIPVELEVWNFSLPRQIHLDSEWGFGWSSIVEQYQGTIGGEVQPCYWELVDAMKQDFINHRLIPKGVPWPAGVNYPGGIEYDCNGKLDPDKDGEWGFGVLGGKYIHGEGGFNGGYGFPVFLALGPESNWPPDSLPSSFCGAPRSGVLGGAEYQAKWTQYLSALDSYLVSDDYSQAAYYHIVNEPQTDEDYTIVGQISALTESAAPHLRQLVSEQVEPAIYNYSGAKIDIWMPTISNYEPEKSHDRQKNYGEEVWWYYLYGDDPPLPNPIMMGHPGIEARITPWLAWAERVDGLLHYSITDWSENPWSTPNVTGQDNGDAFFLYPPRKDGGSLSSCGENGNRLVPSIRWENLRDGMEDYEYLWLLAGDPQVDVANVADDFVSQLVQSRTLFSRVPSDLAAVRQEIAARLGGPQANKSVFPGVVGVGDVFQYILTYTHSGEDTTLVVVDNVPSSTQVLSADPGGAGSVDIVGQKVTWQTPVSMGETVTLTIQAEAGSSTGLVVNTAVFTGTQVLTQSVDLLIAGHQLHLPLVQR